MFSMMYKLPIYGLAVAGFLMSAVMAGGIKLMGGSDALLLVSGIIVLAGFHTLAAAAFTRAVKRLSGVAEQIASGRIDIGTEQGLHHELGELSAALAAIAANNRRQAEEAGRIATGDLTVEVHVKSDQDLMALSMRQIVRTVDTLIAEMNRMSREHDAGDIDVIVPAEQFAGAFRTVAQGVNDMVRGHILVKKKAMACIAEFAKGNFNAELETFPGKKAFINDNIETLRANLREVNQEITQMIQASQEGRLNERGAAARFSGDWAEMIKGLNGLLDAVIEPIQEAAAVLDEMSKGNLKMRVKGEYQGDHAKIKHALNDTISTLSAYTDEISEVMAEMVRGNMDVAISSEYRGDFAAIKLALNQVIHSFNELLNEINNAAGQVAASATQVSGSAQQLSQGASDQASSVQQLTASLEQIGAQTRQNADSASEASNLAEQAKVNAVQGNEQMKQMLHAMEGINESSGNISKIIKVIDEIAFQTNILALNAAVEAARAGQHGKGFAVVAEEVRNLAARSANAAKETTVLIEGSIRKVEGGTKIAKETAAALNSIVVDVARATDLVGAISVASNEQATGISQINQGIVVISHVTQTNSATSQESAAASEQLSSQAETLKELVGRFKLKRTQQPSAYREGQHQQAERGHYGYGQHQRAEPREPHGFERQSTKQGQQQAAAQRIKLTLNRQDYGKY